MRLRHAVLLGALAPLAAIVAAAEGSSVAHAAIVERIVAVVGEQPILLTELRQRARPYLIKIYTQVPPQQQKVAEAEMYKELLNKLVDERVVALAADKLNVTVTTKEVDDAVKLKAADLKVPVSDLLAEAAKQGLSEADYREEVRRELLFGKMLETRVRSRVRVTEDDAREYYKKLQVQERKQQTYRASMIALPLDEGDKAVRGLADKIVKSARVGADFGALARQYSTDATREKGGDLGLRSPTAFGKGVDDVLLRLDEGDVSEPLVSGGRLLIFKITDRPPSQLPAYLEVREAVYNRVREEMMQKQIKVWLGELKSGVYIDVRL
ncbi:MAG: peptidylprolyl isomerase [Deltaproteobacteria bacterium]|nr:peptidylprolyl isomerase [Deltaproteobacteria bacterium]